MGAVGGMNDKARTILAAIKTRNNLPESAAIGVRSVYDAKAGVNTDNGNRDLVITATTQDIDECGDVVVAAGCLDQSNYFWRNKRIFLEHDLHYFSAVGVLRVPIPRPSNQDVKSWQIRIRMYPTELGDELLLIAREYGIGASIGFEAVKFGPPTDAEKRLYSQRGIIPTNVISSWRWIETSITAAPMNVSCQLNGAVSVDESRAIVLDELVRKSRISRRTALALGFKEAAERKGISTIVSKRVIELPATRREVVGE